MSPRKDSPELPEDDLRKLESAYHASAREEPPELLDLAVLNRARAALETPRRAWSFNLTWVHGLATAGVAVLALTLFLQLRDQQPGPELPASYDFQMRAAPASEVLPEGSELPTAVLQETIAEPEEAKQKVDQAPALRSNLESDRDDAALKKEAAQDAVQSVAKDPGQDSAAAAAPAVGAERMEARERSADPMAVQPDNELQAPMAAAPQPIDMVCTEVAVGETRCYNLELATSRFEALQQLRGAGDEAAFDEALAAFKKDFPDFPLPEDWPQ